VTFRYLGLNYTRFYYKVCMFDLVYAKGKGYFYIILKNLGPLVLNG
jgi:hypothetical protein